MKHSVTDDVWASGEVSTVHAWSVVWGDIRSNLPEHEHEKPQESSKEDSEQAVVKPGVAATELFLSHCSPGNTFKKHSYLTERPFSTTQHLIYSLPAVPAVMLFYD